MNLENTKGKKTITFPAEILPKNANTEKILKIREEQEAARKAKEDAVSTSVELHTSETFFAWAKTVSPFLYLPINYLLDHFLLNS